MSFYMQNKLTVIDHSVSGKSFELHYNDAYHMWVTHPKPSKEELPEYYESEDYISHTDGKRSIFEFAYQFVKGIMLSQKHKLIKRYCPQGKTLLDIGAGTGDFLKHCQKNAWIVEGVEPNDGARNRAIEKNLKVQSQIGQISKTYDVITMWHVLEHVYDLEEQMVWLKKHLSKTGVLLVAVPNFESYDASYYGSNWAAYDVPRHLYHFSQKAITTLFAKTAMEIKATHPLHFDAYYVSMLSEKYRGPKSNRLNGIYRGWISNRKAKQTGAYSSLIYVITHKT